MPEKRDANDKRSRREEKVRTAKEEHQQKCQKKGMPRKRDVKTKRHPEEKITKERDAE
jgi:hypothetical protein